MDPNPVLRQIKLPTEAQEDPEKYRFQVELEFVQCLANPQYLNSAIAFSMRHTEPILKAISAVKRKVLAQRGYFKEKEFVNYLSYLQYWKKQEYAKYLKYPQCLHFLDLLQLDQFRRELANAQCTKFIEEQQLLHWHHYTKKRTQFQQRIMAQSKQPPVNK